MYNRVLFYTYRNFKLITVITIVLGCSSPIVKMPEKWPSIVKNYKHIYVSATTPHLRRSGVHLNRGDLFSLVIKGRVKTYNTWYSYGGRLSAYVDGKWYVYPHYNAFVEAYEAGEISFVVRDGPFNLKTGWAENVKWYNDNEGGYSIDIIVWEREDYGKILEFLQNMQRKNPDEEGLKSLLWQAQNSYNLQVAKDTTEKQVKETKEQIKDLKAESLSNNQKNPTKATKDKISDLEAQLEALMIKLSQLDKMKEKLAEEKKKTDLLSQQLAERERREKVLLDRISGANKIPPILLIASPRPNQKTELTSITLSGVIEDDQGIQSIRVYLNDKPIKVNTHRGITYTQKTYPKRVEINQRISLNDGLNNIRINVVDQEGLVAERVLKLQKIKKQRNVWAVIIGINKYPYVPPLKYAVNDANAFYRYLVYENQIPKENLIMLLDEKASLDKLRSYLGTVLKQKADKEDTVIIYFAGHGATERDTMSPDGDGLEKYILPYNAKMNDLYSSAIPMREISYIFNRIKSERLIFIVDACYSGASGGRTVGAPGFRANISDSFLDRISKGKGRIILTASATNEVSIEDDQLKHGVFTYYLIEGLRGRADTDGDSLITVDEAYRYSSEKVKEATGQEQHPLKKGSVEGSLILGIVN